MLERDHEADLLLVALRVLLELARRIDVEALDQRCLVRAVHAATQTREVAQRLAAGEPVVQRELAWDVPDTPVDRDGIRAGLDAEDPGRPARRPDEVEDRPDRRRLAGPVRPQESEHLALIDTQVDIDDAPVRPVGLGELVGLDDRGHGAPSRVPCQPNHCLRTSGSTMTSDPAGRPRYRSRPCQ